MAPKKGHLSIDERPQRCTEPKPGVQTFSHVVLRCQKSLSLASRDQTRIRVLSPPIKIARTVPQARFSAWVFVFGLFYTPFRSAQFLNSHVLQNVYPIRRANCTFFAPSPFSKTQIGP